MKIRKFEFKAYAAEKPLSVSPAGKFLKASDLVGAPSLSLGSLHSLSPSQQLSLTMKRYALEPAFKLGFVGVGILTKKEVLEHIRKKTDFGKVAVQAEMQYCNELASALITNSVPSWPKPPKQLIPKKPVLWKGKWVMVKLPNRALFCENTTDSVTSPFASYRIANVHPAFQARGFRVVVLKGTEDVRQNFVPHAKNGLTVYVGGIGHGSYTIYTGHGGNRILEVGQYDAAEVKGKALHLLSCQTAAQLGPDAVGKGANCYAGYTENFILQWDDSSTPVNEFLLFARADSTFDLQMAAGATAQQAFDATIQAFNAAAAQVPNTVAATYLVWDRDHLRLHGAAATRIVPYRYIRVWMRPPTLEKENSLFLAGESVVK